MLDNIWVWKKNCMYNLKLEYNYIFIRIFLFALGLSNILPYFWNFLIVFTYVKVRILAMWISPARHRYYSMLFVSLLNVIINFGFQNNY